MKPARTVWFFLKDYPGLFLGLLALTVLVSLLEGLNVAVFFPIFHALLGAQGGASPDGLLGSLTGLIQRIPLHDPILGAIALLIGVTVFKCLFLFLRDGLLAIASGQVQHDVKMHLMEAYARSPFAYFLENKQGQLLYNTSTAASRVGILLQKIPQGAAEILKAAAIGGLLLVSMPAATIGLFLVALVYQGLTHWAAHRVSYHTGQERMVAGATEASVANEFLTGVKQILCFGTARHWLERFRKSSDDFRRLVVKDAVWLAVPKVLLELSLVVILFGFLFVWRWVQPETLGRNLPMVGMFAFGLFRLMPSLTLLGQLRMEAAGLMGDAQMLQQVLSASHAQPAQGGGAVPPIRRGIALDRVSFSYPERKPLLRELSMEFRKGEVTALVGPSGSGKTTLVHLILGLVRPTAGRVLVEDVPLSEIDVQKWRGRIGFVSQDLFMLHDTVAENILFGRTGFSPEQIRRAARLAHADAFIEALPGGYQAVIGERGMKLSGGQQQRLAIARAVLNDPEILIFDEATSFLDTESEQGVQRAIESVARNRTVILIAHRLSTVRHADRIVVLEHGSIVEEGRHEELLTGRGRYFEWVRSDRGETAA